MRDNTMKNKIFILPVFLLGFLSTYAQVDTTLLADYKKLVIENDNLKSQMRKSEALYKKEQEETKTLQTENGKLQKEYDKLQAKYNNLSIVKYNKYIKQKDDSIALLQRQFTDKDTLVEQSYLRGKNEVFDNIAGSYKGDFDDLIQKYNKTSVERDQRLVNDNKNAKEVIKALIVYFDVKELLAQKFDANKINDATKRLAKIGVKSKLVADLETDIKKYQSYCDGFKETIAAVEKINLGFPTGPEPNKTILNHKFDKILAEISKYMYYDYPKYDRYPYLSNVVKEVILRKRADPNCDIHDVLDKL